MISDELLPDGVPGTIPVGNEDNMAVTGAADDSMMDDDESLQVRTMEVPRWLSTLDVTKYLVGHGKKRSLEEEYECTIVISGHGSGTKDPTIPGFHLPHLLVTISGHDVRLIGRLRRVLEDSLIDYVIENTPEPEDHRTPPPSLGRLLYSLALSAANASPKTKDHTPDRTVLARSHYPFYLHTRKSHRDSNNDNNNQRGPPTKRVWMNVMELPQDDDTEEYHGRFLAGKNGSLLEYYRTKFQCRVDIYGVWGEDDADDLMCAPYVLVTSEESKHNVDKCLQFIEHRVREHEEKYGASRRSGKRILKGEME
mmetsp:Transcript_8285/g.14965  ORF Transcript_8285/g.14965 Transcript_8285/m.14965 type:complete len:310 (+) Transcript_8285:119-1048(+)